MEEMKYSSGSHHYFLHQQRSNGKLSCKEVKAECKHSRLAIVL
jgi:hypothetical protein